MRFFRQALIGLTLLTLSVGILSYAGYLIKDALSERLGQEARVPQPRERTFAVNVVTAEPKAITPQLEAFGEIKSRRTLDLRLAIGGLVTGLSENFVDGGQVKSGEKLVEIDDADAQSVYQKAKADIMDAKAEIEDAERALLLSQDELEAALKQSGLRETALSRQQDLQVRGVGTKAAVEAAELALSSAEQSVLNRRSAIDQAKARGASAGTRLIRSKLALDDASRRVEDTKLFSKFDGVLSSITLVEGGIVSANERIGQLIDPNSLEVAFRVSTQQYSRLLNENGKLINTRGSVSLNLMGSQITTNAVLERDSGSVAEGQTGRLLYARLDKAIGFKPGDYVVVKLDEPELRFAINLPASALNADNQVLILNDEERLENVNVSLLRRQGDNVIIRSRDLPGKEVVAQRSPLLGIGIKVRAVRSGEADKPPKAPEMIELTEERRQKLIKFIEDNKWIPKTAKERTIGKLKKEKVPAEMVSRIESRMGG
jgi:hypothetical protein